MLVKSSGDKSALRSLQRELTCLELKEFKMPILRSDHPDRVRAVVGIEDGNAGSSERRAVECIHDRAGDFEPCILSGALPGSGILRTRGSARVQQDKRKKSELNRSQEAEHAHSSSVISGNCKRTF